MGTPRPCGCKGVRTCLVCETEFGVSKRDYELQKKHDSYVYCPLCRKAWKGWDINILTEHPNHNGESIDYPGIYIELDFLSLQEQGQLINDIDQVPWDLSQSGRRKQNYGPKCNFKKRKIKLGDFNGFPKFSKFIQQRFLSVPLLEGFQTVEQCTLEYTPERGASIDPHVDDCWVWGERVVTVNVIGDSVLTLNHYCGDHDRYNLADVQTYPRVLNDKGEVIWKPTHEECLKVNKKDIENDPNVKEMSSSENVLCINVDREGHVTKDTCLFPHSKTSSEEIDVKTADSLPICSKSDGTSESYRFVKDEKNVSHPLVRVPMPARSLLVLYGIPRYDWEHSIFREDITRRRVCLAYREFTPPFLKGGRKETVGFEVIQKAMNFW